MGVRIFEFDADGRLLRASALSAAASADAPGSSATCA